MVNEGELPDIDMKMPLDFDLGAKLDLDLPSPTMDFPPMAPAAPAPAQSPATAKKPAPASPASKPAATKAKPAKPVKQKAEKGTSVNGISLPLVMNLLSVFLLVVIAGIMFVFEVPINVVPDLTLTTYVQSLWLAAGCFFVVAMLQDFKTALILTGVDALLLISVFPTLWLLMGMPMNPMYFFVMGMIALLAFVYLPLNLLGTGKQGAAKGK